MDLDLAIIGAGPVGLAAAITAKRRGLHYAVFDKGVLVNSIFNFPAHMTFFTTATLLEIGGHPFPSTAQKPTRMMALDYYRLVAQREELEVHTHHQVLEVQGSEGEFVLKVKELRPSGFTQTKEVRARYVVVATGYFDNPRGIDAPGSNLPHVHMYYTEPHPFFDKDVVVIGAGNSGAEASLELYRHGARVALVHNDKEPKPTVKYWVAPDLKNRLKEGVIRGVMPAKVVEITRTHVVVNYDGREEKLPADAVFVLTGFRPNVELLRSLGVSLDNELRAELTEAFESTREGVFLIGSVGFGKFTNAVFIENGREHAEVAVNEIAARIQQPDYVPVKTPLSLEIRPTNT